MTKRTGKFNRPEIRKRAFGNMPLTTLHATPMSVAELTTRNCAAAPTPRCANSIRTFEPDRHPERQPRP